MCARCREGCFFPSHALCGWLCFLSPKPSSPFSPLPLPSPLPLTLLSVTPSLSLSPHPLSLLVLEDPCIWLVTGQSIYPSLFPSPQLTLLWQRWGVWGATLHQSRLPSLLQLAWPGCSQAEQVRSGRWWKNVDKFLICNTLGKSLLPLFEDECVNKARRRWRGRPGRGRKREILWP